MTWRPYPYVAGWDETGPKVVRRGSVRFDRDIWMFCHKIVEMQLASRTMRQFGRVQIIPPTITPVSQSKALSGRRESRSIRSRFRSELINWENGGQGIESAYGEGAVKEYLPWYWDFGMSTLFQTQSQGAANFIIGPTDRELEMAERESKMIDRLQE